MSKDIFRIEGFVEDKNLAKVKRLLMGLVFEFKDQPVVNAKTGPNGISAKTSGDVSDMLLAYCKEHKLTDISASHVRDFLRSVGRPETGLSYTLTKAKKDGVLKKLGKGTSSHYRVVFK